MLGIASGDDEDGDESSSFIEQYKVQKTQLESALEVFRENWRHELQPIAESNSTEIKVFAVPEQEDDETKAQRLFQLGVEYEKRGKVYDALKFYRKAVQIIPDIEFRAYDTSKKQSASNENKGNAIPLCEVENVKNTENSLTLVDNDEEDLSNVDLLSKFQNDLMEQDSFISSTIDSNVLTTELHISNLPTEIILYIFRWVISAQLDMRSLEHCSAVCKGFYICARDEKIWKMACTKVWGLNAGNILKPPYLTWRQMFIERNRVQFNGCYISKTKYIRYGENSFQSEFYRPMQIIEYYRYFRFLPDGVVLMMTSSDEPAQAVSKLKNVKHIPSDVLRGQYRIHDDVIILIIKKQQKPGQLILKRRSNAATDPGNSSTYQIEFTIANISSNKRFAKLLWKHYSITQIKNKMEIPNPFELTPSKFPPLWFSHVKSYHLDADAPL